MAAIVALALVGPASAAEPRGGNQGERRLATLEAHLTGEQEVPGPGDPNGVGNAVVKVFRMKACSTLEVKRIEPASAAHIHLGFRGEAGPIVATLKPPTDGFSRGCVEIPRALSRWLREHPSRYYVNVQNAEYPPPERSGGSSLGNPRPTTSRPKIGAGVYHLGPSSWLYPPNLVEG